MLQDELEFFIAKQAELVAKYRGQVLLIKDREVVGAYATPLKAFLAAQERFKPGEYMIQPCQPGPEAYTVTITSTEVFGGIPG